MPTVTSALGLSGIRAGVRAACVFLVVFLGDAIEGDRGNRTLQARGCHPPGTVGATPAAEVVAVDPN